MQRFLMVISLVLMFILVPLKVQALNLFATNINNTDRVAFREAIRNSGANVVREAGEDNWFDVYDMSASFKQSKRFFVGYDKASGRFAFAEHQLAYNYFSTMLLRLQAKYGEATKTFGKFDSDLKYSWVVDGITIELQQQWAKNNTRLSYIHPQNLQALQQAYRQFKSTVFAESLKTNESYF